MFVIGERLYDHPVRFFSQTVTGSVFCPAVEGRGRLQDKMWCCDVKWSHYKHSSILIIKSMWQSEKYPIQKKIILH